jgi:arginine/lysine/ornithine decarboxylase
VTELFFTDNLYAPDENLRLVLNLEERAARIFFPQNQKNQKNQKIQKNQNPVKSTISCGGATLCVQAALLAVLRGNNADNTSATSGTSGTSGKKYIICARDCHISLVNALALLDIEPVWVYEPDSFEKEFNANISKNIIAAFVTSPNYYGSMCNIAEIARVCRKYNAPLIADNAHGSHLAFHRDKKGRNGGLHPVNQGADIVIDSVHKTLPALTGAALVHSVPKYDIRGAMQIFASTSPSYLILQSIEKMLDCLELYGKAEHRRLLDDITKLRNESAASEYLKIRGDDPFRIVLSRKNFGERLYHFLFEANIACEFYERDRVVIIPGIFNKSGDFGLLAAALRDFTRENNIDTADAADTKDIMKTKDIMEIMEIPRCGVSEFPPAVPALSLGEAVRSPRELVKTSDAAGRVCAESIFAYPPGIPLVLPGEIITGNTAANLNLNLKRKEIYVTVDKMSGACYNFKKQ